MPVRSVEPFSDSDDAADTYNPWKSLIDPEEVQMGVAEHVPIHAVDLQNVELFFQVVSEKGAGRPAADTGERDADGPPLSNIRMASLDEEEEGRERHREAAEAESKTEWGIPNSQPDQQVQGDD